MVKGKMKSLRKQQQSLFSEQCILRNCLRIQLKNLQSTGHMFISPPRPCTCRGEGLGEEKKEMLSTDN